MAALVMTNSSTPHHARLVAALEFAFQRMGHPHAPAYTYVMSA